VAVEKLSFLKNLPNFGDRKCPDDPRESLIAHPDAIFFFALFLVRSFSTATPVYDTLIPILR
jgi:hypothetical protein